MDFEFDLAAFEAQRRKFAESEAKSHQLKMEVEMAGQIYNALHRENNIGDQTQVVLKGNDVSQVVKDTVSDVKNVVKKRVRFDKKVRVSSNEIRGLFKAIYLFLLDSRVSTRMSKNDFFYSGSERSQSVLFASFTAEQALRFHEIEISSR